MNDDTTTLRLRMPVADNASLPTGATRTALETLGRRIANDTYAEGSVMPTEAELAASLDVSRATARDAVKVLSGKGLVRTARRYGTRVRPAAEWNLLDADVISWHDPGHPRIRTMFVETTELRCILEPEAAALAAERATPEQRRAIHAAATEMQAERQSLQDLFDADCRFHTAMLEATGNRMMLQLGGIIVATVRISYEFGILANDGETVSREGHLRVANAILAGDPGRAKAEMAAMLARNRRTASGRLQGFSARAASDPQGVGSR